MKFNRTIWKFGPFRINEPQVVRGCPLHVGVQNNELFVWTEVWTECEPKEDLNVKLVFIPTGQEYDGIYVGTVNQDGFMWHCIEMLEFEDEEAK